MRYARVAPDRIAGTVSVSCTQSASRDETEVTVTYDVTSLGPEGAAFVEELETGFDAFLANWRVEILTGLADSDDADTKEGEMSPDSPLTRG
jgi:hypothetical protein